MLCALIGLVVPLEGMRAALRPPDVTKRFGPEVLRRLVAEQRGATG